MPVIFSERRPRNWHSGFSSIISRQTSPLPLSVHGQNRSRPNVFFVRGRSDQVEPPRNPMNGLSAVAKSSTATGGWRESGGAGEGDTSRVLTMTPGGRSGCLNGEHRPSRSAEGVTGVELPDVRWLIEDAVSLRGDGDRARRSRALNRDTPFDREE